MAERRQSARARVALLAAGAAVLSAGGALLSGFQYPADSYCAFVHGSAAWQPVVHAASNAFFLWRSIPLLAELGCSTYLALFAAIAAFGFVVLALWGDADTPKPRKAGVGAAVSIAAAVVLLAYIFGADIAVFSALAVLPWMIAAVIRMRAHPSAAAALNLLLVSLLSAFVAQQLAAGCALLALLYGAFAQPADRRNRLAPILLLGPVLIAALIWPAPELPQYPRTGGTHVVPEYGTAVLDGPRFGAEPFPAVIDREYERAAFLVPALLCAAMLIWLAALRRRTAAQPAAWSCALLLCSMLLLDSFLLPADLVQVMPVQTLRRLLPQWSFLPVANMLSAAAVLLTFVACAAAQLPQRATLAGQLLLAALIAASQLPGRNARLIRSEADAGGLRELAACRNGASCAALARAALSPSYYVLKTEGAWIVRDRKELLALETRALAAEDVQVEVSHNAAATPHIFDGDPRTRWTPGRGAQQGDEWILLHFPAAQQVRGIEISSGSFYTDFPRGVEVYAAGECDGGGIPDGAELVVSAPSWQGALRSTADGYPYREPPHQIRIVFPEEHRARCLLVRQVGTDARHDWSIDALSLLVPPAAGEENAA